VEASSLGWAAGLFEGEGNAKVYVVHVAAYNKTEGKVVRYVSRRPTIQVVNTDISLLARFRVIVGVGTIRIAKRKNAKQQLLLHYRVQSRKADLVARLLLPYIVSERKRLQLKSITDYYDHFAPTWDRSAASRKVWASYNPEQRRERNLAVSKGRRKNAKKRA
jgi:hypothetical protein